MLVGSPMVDVRRARLALAALATLAIGRPLPAAAQTREMSRDMGSYVLFALEQMRTKGIRIGPGGEVRADRQQSEGDRADRNDLHAIEDGLSCYRALSRAPLPADGLECDCRRMPRRVPRIHH